VKLIVILGYEYGALPLEPAVSAFELLASRKILLGKRHEAAFKNLVPPKFIVKEPSWLGLSR
jgi:hypothetical protein